MRKFRDALKYKVIGVLLIIFCSALVFFFGFVSWMKVNGEWYKDGQTSFYETITCNNIMENHVSDLYYNYYSGTVDVDDLKECFSYLGDNYVYRIAHWNGISYDIIFDSIEDESKYPVVQNYILSEYGNYVDLYHTEEQFEVTKEIGEIVVSVGLVDPMEADSSQLYSTYKLYNELQSWGKYAEELFIGNIILLLVLFGFEMYMAGHKEGEEEIYRTWIDKLPLIVVLIVFAFASYLFVCFMSLSSNSLYYFGSIYSVFLQMISFTATGVFFTLVVLILLYTLMVRIKSHTLFSSMLTGMVFHFLKDRVVDSIYQFHNSTAFYKNIMVLLFIITIAQAFFLFALADQLDNLTFYFLIIMLILFLIELFFFYTCIKMNNDSKALLEEGRALASGDLNQRIPQEQIQKLNGPFYEHANNLNSIGEGMQKAIQSELKSERMKAELITNVSHDIKTPLTSIINYVDLLSKESDEDKKKDYIEVIQRQSQRLKKLTEDVVEASKASTGAIEAHMETVSIQEILNQALAEYEERMDEKNLTVIQSCPDNNLFVKADGRLLWRVLRNLFSNVSKYALEGTRVYIDVKELEDYKVSVQIKNTSKDQLNISEDELMQRFVRGDSSRHTEGSGLGLSIVESLTELMHGTFQIKIDGDLFKNELILQEAEKEEKNPLDVTIE